MECPSATNPRSGAIHRYPSRCPVHPQRWIGRSSAALTVGGQAEGTCEENTAIWRQMLTGHLAREWLVRRRFTLA